MIELDVINQADAATDGTSSKREDGDRLWRSFSDLQDDPEARRLEQQEFMPGASDPPTKSSRRTFMKLMGASMAMAGLSACRRPEEHILPYARKPEEVIPGVPRYYATAMPFRGIVRGLLVQSHEGRPTKVEGNPEHPLSQGTTSGFAQASVLNLYDPWRSKTVQHEGSEATQDEMMRLFGRLSSGGASTRLAVLMEETSSPAIARVREDLQQAYPQLRWVEYSAEGDDAERLGLQQATGRAQRPLYRFDEADVIVSLDADFLSPTHRNYVSNTRTFAAGRRLDGPDEEMSRLYCVESQLSLTGGQADHRLQMRPTKVAAFAQALASQMGAGSGSAATGGQQMSRRERAFVEEMAQDLQQAGRGVVVAGETQPPAVHALAMRLNRQLGATGQTVHLMDTGEGARRPFSQEMAGLTRAMQNGQVDALVMIGANPLYDLPPSLGFREAMSSVETTIHSGLRLNETAQAADWHIPRSHYLEAWGDGRAYDGTVSIVQPLIEPLYDSRSDLELLSMLATGRSQEGYDLLLAQWQERFGEGESFDRKWRRLLHDGYLPGSQYTGAPGPPQSASGPATSTPSAEVFSGGAFGAAAAAPSGDGASQNPQLDVGGTQGGTPSSAASQQPPEATGDAGGYDVVIRPDPALLSGRFSNNAWMQELPDPTTKIVWDNVAVMSKKTADDLGLSISLDTGQYWADVARITVGGQSVELPIWVQPGYPHGTIGLTTGYGRNIEGSHVGLDKGWFRNLTDAYDSIYNGDPLANGVGQRVAPLQGASLSRVLTGAQVEKAGEDYMLATTQNHGTMNGRPIVRRASMEAFHENPNFAEDAVHTLPGGEPWDEYPMLWKNHPSDQPAYKDSDFYENQWGMTVDLNTCTGCNACMVACQSENNVQVVGKEQVAEGREMHWLRIDRYFVSPEEGAGHGEEVEGPDIDGEVGPYGDEDAASYDRAEMVMQPVMCQHCENAPCESVCPVAATVHSPDGTNQMIYNRCIGTRYCSNNCPYKVRHFNFYNWSYRLPEQVGMAQNPNVTVRSRGVMEKCSWCVQRIRENQSRADNENRPLEDGDVVTACQQVCPADAIVFGDLNDPSSKVNRQKKNPRNYALLAELNTKPRLSYLGRVSNPNPALQERLDRLAGRRREHEGAAHG